MAKLQGRLSCHDGQDRRSAGRLRVRRSLGRRLRAEGRGDDAEHRRDKRPGNDVAAPAAGFADQADAQRNAVWQLSRGIVESDSRRGILELDEQLRLHAGRLAVPVRHGEPTVRDIPVTHSSSSIYFYLFQ